MSTWAIAAGVYVVVAIAALVVTGLLRFFWRNVFLEVFPVMIKGFWDVYPGRKWPGPLKVIGYPMTIGFLLTVGAIFIAFELLLSRRDLAQSYLVGSATDSRSAQRSTPGFIAFGCTQGAGSWMSARSPNPRLQRTRWRSPLSRQPLGGRKVS